MDDAELISQIDPPAEALALSTLEAIDYADAFLVEVGDTGRRTPEAWARAILEDAPAKVRNGLLAGWSSLGLPVVWARGDGTVLGWAVRRSTAGHVLLAGRSPLGLSAELLVRPRGSELLFCTLVHQENPAARALWAGVERVHVPVVRHVLGLAAAREREPAQEARGR